MKVNIDITCCDIKTKEILVVTNCDNQEYGAVTVLVCKTNLLIKLS